MKKKKYLKCDICGRFIGYSEFDRNEILIEYTPDSHFTKEEINYVHKKCENIIQG